MITRLLLSLKKAGAPREHGWSLGQPTAHTIMRFAERRGGAATRDEVPLGTFVGTQERTRSHGSDFTSDLIPFLRRKPEDLAA